VILNRLEAELSELDKKLKLWASTFVNSNAINTVEVTKSAFVLYTITF
jgi:hypothetical protein